MIHDGKDRGLGRVSNVEMGVKALKYRGGRLKEVGGKGEIGLKSSRVQSLRRLVAADGLAEMFTFTIFNLLIFAYPSREYANPRMPRDDCTGGPRYSSPRYLSFHSFVLSILWKTTKKVPTLSSFKFFSFCLHNVFRPPV